MKYKALGNTGLRVSELCLGTMTFGDKGFFKVMGSLGQQEANELVKQAFDAGVNFIDTANVYAEGLSEEITGKAIRDVGLRRYDVVLATKVKGNMGPGPNDVGLSRKHIMQQVEASLKRLNTDYIDLYQIHSFDPGTPLEETLDTFDGLVKSGKVRYIGASNLMAWQLMKSLAYAHYNHQEKFVSLQAYYSLANRELERELIPLLDDQKLGLMVWSPLSGGLLSGKYKRNGGDAEAVGRLANFNSVMPMDEERAFNTLDVLHQLAQGKGVSVAQLALAWLRYQPTVTSVIVGATKTSQLQDNIKSLDVVFTDDELKQIDQVSALTDEYPASLLKRVSTLLQQQDPANKV